jgi:hypothetical protein
MTPGIYPSATTKHQPQIEIVKLLMRETARRTAVLYSESSDMRYLNVPDQTLLAYGQLVDDAQFTQDWVQE